MSSVFDTLPFRPADILMPTVPDLTRWSVVACDQYTSQPEYWQRVEEFVGRAPSSLRLILPEGCLEGPDVEHDIMEINNSMARYLQKGRFASWPDSLFYVERTLESGTVRKGLIGMVDLKQYDYEEGSVSPVRATEGTVPSRIPPRVAVRKNAPIELPHTMLLADDPDFTLIEPLASQTSSMRSLYDFELMEHGGHIRGWVLTPEQKEQVGQALKALADRAAAKSQHPMVLAVGDGNHSLATAKECYERQKRLVPPDQWDRLPARFALCELVNLHDDSMVFEPIHRVLFGAGLEDVTAAFTRYYPQAQGEEIPVCGRDSSATLRVPAGILPVASVQAFLDDYQSRRPGVRVDYIHGDDVARDLVRYHRDAVAFLLPPMDRKDLFPAVEQQGSLPRKTFSVGHAQDKRFYLEARRIRN